MKFEGPGTMPSSKGKPTDPELRKEVVEEVKQLPNKDGSGQGKMAAWKSSKISKEYEARGGGYEDLPDAPNKAAKGVPQPKTSPPKSTRMTRASKASESAAKSQDKAPEKEGATTTTTTTTSKKATAASKKAEAAENEVRKAAAGAAPGAVAKAKDANAEAVAEDAAASKGRDNAQKVTVKPSVEQVRNASAEADAVFISGDTYPEQMTPVNDSEYTPGKSAGVEEGGRESEVAIEGSGMESVSVEPQAGTPVGKEAEERPKGKEGKESQTQYNKMDFPEQSVARDDGEFLPGKSVGVEEVGGDESEVAVEGSVSVEPGAGQGQKRKAGNVKEKGEEKKVRN